MSSNRGLQGFLGFLVVLLLGVPRAGGLAQEVPSGGLEEAQKAAGLLVRDRLREDNPAAFARLRRCPPRSILLVEGHYDHTDRVLRGLRLPFRSCPAAALERESLRGVRLLIVDCPGQVGRGGVERIRRFVADGGTLLTTDWAVLHVLEEAFPGLVRYTRRPTRDDVVRISRVENDPLLHRLFPPGRPACWWIENRSFPVEVLDRRVRVLLASREMERKYGSPVLGLSFRWRRGRVVHVVSHTYLQRNELRIAWERRSALEEARSLGLPTESGAFRRLKSSGALARLPAGHLNAALSAQQLLLNIAVAALESAPEERPPAEIPPPPPAVRPPPPAPGDALRAARTTQLRERPGGTPVLHVARGLRLRPLEERDGWVRVRTPAGQSGWVAHEDLASPR
jgi:hypothetical protein